MNYLRLSPCEPLRPYVESIWIQEAEAPTTTSAALDPLHLSSTPQKWTRILPTSMIDLVFFYGDPFVRTTDSGPSIEPRLAINGQRTSPFEVAATGRTGVLIVRFFPFGLRAFFDVSVAEFTDRVIDLQDIVGSRENRALQERLHDPEPSSSRGSILEAYLLARLSRGVENFDPLVADLACCIRDHSNTIQIEDLAQIASLSRRQLTRRFQNATGLSPKVLSRILRFQRALSYRSRSGHSLGQIARACGYFDQAHFTREFRSLSGHTPKEIFQGSRNTPLSTFFNGENRDRFYSTVYL